MSCFHFLVRDNSGSELYERKYLIHLANFAKKKISIFHESFWYFPLYIYNCILDEIFPHLTDFGKKCSKSLKFSPENDHMVYILCYMLMISRLSSVLTKISKAGIPTGS